MRKSRSIRLVLLSSLSLVALAACEENDPLKSADIIRDEKECASRPDPGACRSALRDAREQHVAAAPKFGDLASCEAKFGTGNCTTPDQILRFGDEAQTQPQQAQPQQAQQTQQGSSSFMPMLVGYMMGRAMSGGSPWAAQPLYRDRDNMGYAGNRTGAATQVGTLSGARFRDIAPASAGGTSRGTAAGDTAVKRGGFGSSGAASASAGG